MGMVCERSVCLCLKKNTSGGICQACKMPGLSQERFMAISIRLKALNWDKVQLLL